MRPRALLVAGLLAICAFLGLYAAGLASEGDEDPELSAPAALGEPVRDAGAPPRLGSPGALPKLAPARRAPVAPVAVPVPVAPTPAPEQTPAPVPVPAPTPAPAPAPEPFPPSNGGGGQPFHDEG